MVERYRAFEFGFSNYRNRFVSFGYKKNRGALGQTRVKLFNRMALNCNLYFVFRTTDAIDGIFYHVIPYDTNHGTNFKIY